MLGTPVSDLFLSTGEKHSAGPGITRDTWACCPHLLEGKKEFSPSHSQFGTKYM